jgi:cell division protein FtsB
MAESVIEEVLTLRRWVLLSVVLNVLSLLIIAGIGVGLKVAVTTVADQASSKLEQLATENKQLREENLKLTQQAAGRGY